MQYMTRYDELPTDELLAALETVGRLPDLDLIPRVHGAPGRTDANAAGVVGRRQRRPIPVR